jgi:formate dehydrogenase subunit gamma
MNEKQQTSTQGRRRRYRRIALWSLFLMLSLSMLLPLGGYVYVGIKDAQAQGVQQTNPRANYWRAVREGNTGYTAVPGAEAGVLIQDGGHNWRQIRNGYVANYGGWLVFLVLFAILLFFAKKGPIPIEKGRSGRKVKRWNGFERTVHWCTATMFIILAITGMSMLFGRAVLIPLMGPKGFAAWADIAIGLHNNVGPVFGAFVVILIAMLIRHNIPNSIDVKWFKTGGGIVGNAHPDSEFANGGEKFWFWFICTVGLASIVAGLVMNFPNWDFTREQMQIANVIHGICGMLWVLLWFGHAYIGSVGSEGSLEGMTSGYVDENWAEQHHNLWLAEVKKSGGSEAAPEVRDDPAAAGGSPA